MARRVYAIIPYMEQPAKRSKTYHSASYLASAFVFYGALMFLLSRSLGLILLFAEAITRKRDNQALPEQFTFWGILGILLVIGVIAGVFTLLLLARQRRLRMRRGNLYLLLNLLLAAWGVIHAISNLVEMVLFFEFLNFFDFLALIGALILPSVLLQIADRKKQPPNDNAALAASVSALACAGIAALIIIVLAFRKSYATAFPLMRDLLFQAALLLFGGAGLQKALKLRAELPLAAPVERPSEPEYRECPDCGKRVSVKLAVCPRCGYALGAASLFSEEEPDDPPPIDTAKPVTPAPEPAKKPARVVISDGTAACERCKRRIPKGLATCPFCGYFPGDPERSEPEPPPKKSEPDAAHDVPRMRYVPRTEERPPCPRCGRRIPGGLATCPFCGYYPDDAPAQEPEREPVPAEPADPYQTLFTADLGAEDALERPPRPKKRKYVEIPNVRLNEKNSIVCPQCGRKFFAALDECPLCGFGLYDD